MTAFMSPYCPVITNSVQSFAAAPRMKFSWSSSSSVSDSWKDRLRHRICSGDSDQEHSARAGSIAWALWFVSLLPGDTPEPEVVLEEDGDVALDWEASANSTFSISIDSDGIMRFGGLFRDATRYGRERLASSIPPEILALIARTGAERGSNVRAA